MRNASDIPELSLREAIEMGFRIEKVKVHDNQLGEPADRWLVILKDRPISSHQVSSDAIGRIIELARSF